MESILTKVLDKLLQKWLDQRTPKREAARKFMALYSNMSTCHETYRIYRSDLTEFNYKEWRRSVIELVSSHSALKDYLDIYCEDTAELVRKYAHIEEFGPDTSELAIQDFTGYALMEKIILYAEMPEDNVDFEQARRKLGSFIKEHFDLEDLFYV